MNRQGAEDAKLPEPDLELDHVARVVVDAALEVHRILGPGLLERGSTSSWPNAWHQARDPDPLILGALRRLGG